ncbi:hypothetical protein PVAP13_4NG144819 [Panicum virgatum]|uniref:Uncharacterized protein n=1 Tax=Panicum virgatum TaxID=38727 RepID=A0A8T0T6A1_PANVG|nr:hypothetical protein PVAP13_4NG144819 [Panicum virgatum]
MEPEPEREHEDAHAAAHVERSRWRRGAPRRPGIRRAPPLTSIPPRARRPPSGRRSRKRRREPRRPLLPAVQPPCSSDARALAGGRCSAPPPPWLLLCSAPPRPGRRRERGWAAGEGGGAPPRAGPVLGTLPASVPAAVATRMGELHPWPCSWARPRAQRGPSSPASRALRSRGERGRPPRAPSERPARGWPKRWERVKESDGGGEERMAEGMRIRCSNCTCSCAADTWAPRRMGPHVSGTTARAVTAPDLRRGGGDGRGRRREKIK